MDFQLDTDLDTITLADEGVRVPLRRIDGSAHLNPKKEPVGLILYGSDSATYRQASRALARKRVERAQQSQGRTVPDDQLDAAERDALELLVACTKGWFGVLDSKKADIAFSADGIAEFYRRYPPAREQADSAIMDRSRFTKASSGA